MEIAMGCPYCRRKDRYIVELESALIVQRDSAASFLADAESFGRKRDETLRFARYAMTQGEHHKTWVIDQMVRALTGARYDEWVSEFGDKWDRGIAP